MLLRNATAAIALAAFFVPQAASAQPARTQVGVLTCESAVTPSFIIGSIRGVRCIFVPSPGMPGIPINYAGTVTRFGLDIGITQRTVMMWGVFAPTRVPVGFADLVGAYGGISGQVSVIYGVGGNALFGGSQNTFMLQPFSGEGMEGFNLAVGVAGLELH